MMRSVSAFSPARTRQRTSACTARAARSASGLRLGDAPVCGRRFAEGGRTAFQPPGFGPIGALIDGIRGGRRQRRGIRGRAVASEDDDGIGRTRADRRFKRARRGKVRRLPVERAHAVLPISAEAFGEKLALRGEIRLIGLLRAAPGEFLLAGERIVHEPQHARRGRKHT